MKKRFFRVSISFLLFLLVLLFVPIAICICFLVDGFNVNDWKYYFGVLVSLVFVTYACKNIFFHITFEKNSVRITGDAMLKDEKIQYPCSVNYCDIINIDLILSSNDSRNKPIKLAWLSSIIPKSYIEIKTEKKTIRFCVTYYSNYQKQKIINEIRKRCEMVGNHLHMEDTKTIYENYKSKKKNVFHDFNNKNNRNGNNQ